MSEYSNILLNFMTMINQIKLYHWQTLIHPRHVTTDKYYEKLNELIDKFIENLTGRLIIKNNNSKFRIQLNKPIVLLNIDQDYNFGNKILVEYITYLQSNEFNNIIKEYTELLNIRDEMLSILNNMVYLFTLK